jgi:hypothetical protein
MFVLNPKISSTSLAELQWHRHFFRMQHLETGSFQKR